MSAVFVSPNLMFASRVSGAAATLKVPMQVLASASDVPGKVTGNTRLVIIDLSQSGLDLPNLVGEIRGKAPAARIVAFGPHVNEAELAAARAAGCDDVMPNSQFDRTYVELLRKWGLAE